MLHEYARGDENIRQVSFPVCGGHATKSRAGQWNTSTRAVHKDWAMIHAGWSLPAGWGAAEASVPGVRVHGGDGGWRRRAARLGLLSDLLLQSKISYWLV